MLRKRGVVGRARIDAMKRILGLCLVALMCVEVAAPPKGKEPAKGKVPGHERPVVVPRAASSEADVSAGLPVDSRRAAPTVSGEALGAVKLRPSYASRTCKDGWFLPEQECMVAYDAFCAAPSVEAFYFCRDKYHEREPSYKGLVRTATLRWFHHLVSTHHDSDDVRMVCNDYLREHAGEALFKNPKGVFGTTVKCQNPYCFALRANEDAKQRRIFCSGGCEREVKCLSIAVSALPLGAVKNETPACRITRSATHKSGAAGEKRVGVAAPHSPGLSVDESVLPKQASPLSDAPLASVVATASSVSHVPYAAPTVSEPTALEAVKDVSAASDGVAIDEFFHPKQASPLSDALLASGADTASSASYVSEAAPTVSEPTVPLEAAPVLVVEKESFVFPGVVAELPTGDDGTASSASHVPEAESTVSEPTAPQAAAPVSVVEKESSSAPVSDIKDDDRELDDEWELCDEQYV